MHVPFIRAEDSETASSSKEGTAESVGDYSDDFESSSDEEADRELIRLPNASERKHNAVRRGVRSGASSSTVDTSSLGRLSIFRNCILIITCG